MSRSRLTFRRQGSLYVPPVEASGLVHAHGLGSGAPELSPAPGSWEANLPAGLALDIDTTFDGAFPANFGTHADGWSATGSFSKVTAAGGSSDGPDAFQVAGTAYAAGSLGGGVGGATLYTEGETHRQIYYCVSVYLPANYVVHYNEEKFIYPRGGGGSANNMILDFIAPNPTDHGVASASAGELADFWVFAVSPQSGTSSWRRIQPNADVVPRKGEWNIIEVYAQQNSSGVSDGVMRAWVNGALAWEMDDVRWTDSGDGYWTGLYVDGTRGGASSLNAVPSGGQYRQYGRLSYHASTSRT